MTWALWDRNVRVGRHDTYVTHDDVHGEYAVGTTITLMADNDDEPSDICWDAVVTRVEDRFVYVMLSPAGPWEVVP